MVFYLLQFTLPHLVSWFLSCVTKCAFCEKLSHFQRVNDADFWFSHFNLIIKEKAIIDCPIDPLLRPDPFIKFPRSFVLSRSLARSRTKPHRNYPYWNLILSFIKHLTPQKVSLTFSLRNFWKQRIQKSKEERKSTPPPPKRKKSIQFFHFTQKSK